MRKRAWPDRHPKILCFSNCNKLGLEKCNNLWRQATLKMQVFPNKAPMILQQEILPQFRVPDSLFATCAEDDAATKTSKKHFQLAELICAPQFWAYIYVTLVLNANQCQTKCCKRFIHLLSTMHNWAKKLEACTLLTHIDQSKNCFYFTTTFDNHLTH